MADVVYILTNEAMPGLVKVGKTKSNLLGRMRGLDTTGVPLPFECFFAAEVSDCDVAEKLLHDAFFDQRVRKSREFFRVAPERIASALKLAAIKEITPSQSTAADKDDRLALEKAKERRARFNFKMVGIPVGAVLSHNKDETCTCTVVSNHAVDFEGTQQSLSQSALTVFHRLGYTWSAVSGPESWIFEGETLHERRLRLEDEE